MDQKEYLESLEMNIGLEFTPCESSNISGYAYDGKKKHLWIAFNSHKVYQYEKVDKSVFEGLNKAESKGKYVNANLVKSEVPYTAYELKN